MKSVRTSIPVKLGFFGFPKPQHKQSFVEDIRKLVLEACKSAEGHDNLRARSVIYNAGDAAISLITGIWEDPDKLKNVCRNLHVYFDFDNDYTVWKVTVAYGKSMLCPLLSNAVHPNFVDVIKEERKDLFDRYGFKDEVDTRKWMVFFQGKQAEMTSEELRKFREEFAKMHTLSLRRKIMINGWEDAIKRVKYAIEYGLHCNDLNFGEIEDDICFAFDQLAKQNGLPEIDWEYHEDETEEDDT